VGPLIKIFSTIASIVGGIVGGKLLADTWTKVTGEDAPTKKNKEAQEAQSVVRIAVFTAAAAALGTIIKVGTQRAGDRLVERVKKHPEEV
jgi:hypothetical protein